MPTTGEAGPLLTVRLTGRQVWSPEYFSCRETSMVAMRNLLLPVAAAFVMGFGLSGAAVAQTKNAAPPAAATTNTDDPFGEQVTLTEQTIVYVSGSGQWDTAYETIVNAFKTVNGGLEKLGIKAAGAPMTIYTETNDTGFKFQAAVPVKDSPPLPQESELKTGKSPGGAALKFVHRGSYDAMDTTYEAITDHLEERKLEAKELFVEQYMKDPVGTPDDELVIDIYVPLKGDAATTLGQKGP
jgi:effector-binding domain-containing protein